MIRYFFDVVCQSRTELDYCGHDLPAPDKACHLAELLALDLAMEPDDKWHGWEIYVRTDEGYTLFRIPVRSNCLALA